jgi:Spy/CpxP family protein refolding chaperone
MANPTADLRNNDRKSAKFHNPGLRLRPGFQKFPALKQSQRQQLQLIIKAPRSRSDLRTQSYHARRKFGRYIKLSVELATLKGADLMDSQKVNAYAALIFGVVVSTWHPPLIPGAGASRKARLDRAGRVGDDG